MTLYSGLFDRFSHADPNSPYQMGDQDKNKAFRQGLLQMAAAISKPNGGNFTNSIASGLLAGSNSMNDAQAQYGNDAYRGDIMKRTQADMARNTQMQQMGQQYAKPDGSFDFEGYSNALAQFDPSAAMDMHAKLHPAAKAPELKTDDNGKMWQVTPNGLVPYGVAGAQAAPQGPPMQMGGPTGGSASLLGSAFHSAQMQAESGGNDSATSPKGAFGRMQIMPATAANPGFGMQPIDLATATPQQNEAFGSQYMDHVTAAAGGDPRMGLAAYNWGIGNVQKALAQPGATPESVMAQAPAETQNYVSKIMGGAQAAPSQSGPTFGAKQKGGAGDIEKNTQKIRDFEASSMGRKLTPSEEQMALATGKLPGEAEPQTWDEGLSPARRALVQKVASFGVLPSDLGRGDRQDAIGRASMLNPDYNVGAAKEAYTFLNGLAQAGPTQLGGQVNSINTASDHMGTMLQVNKDLSSDSVFTPINELRNKWNATATQKTAIQNWDQAKYLISQEAAKMVKGGVAAEGEVDDLVKSLDGAKTQAARNSALAVLGQFFYGRIKPLDIQAQRVLGGMHTGTSLMSAEAERNLRAAMGLGLRGTGHAAVPDMMPPGDEHTYVKRFSQSDAPSAAAQPSGKTITKTGMYGGKKVVQYSDGSVDYAN